MSIEDGDEKAREFNVNFIETSAKAGLNIKVWHPTWLPARLCLGVLLGLGWTCLILLTQCTRPRAPTDPALPHCILGRTSPTRVQALFRKIAAALPGMESVNQNKQEQAEQVGKLCGHLRVPGCIRLACWQTASVLRAAIRKGAGVRGSCAQAPGARTPRRLALMTC